MLIQENQVLAVCSTKLTSTQQTYPVSDKESLSAEKGLAAFSNMIKGAEIMSHADHKTLTHSPTTNHQSDRVLRQMIRAKQEFGVKEFGQISGDRTSGPDRVSRLPVTNDFPGK